MIRLPNRTAAMLAVSAVSIAVASRAGAEFLGYAFDLHAVTSSGQDYLICDVYGQFDDALDTVTAVFNAQISELSGSAFHHDDLNTLGGQAGAWTATLSADIPGVVDARIDSFVRIGGPIGGLNTTVLDASFDPATGGTVPEGAGWFNGEPGNLQGGVAPDTLRVHLARLSLFGINSASVYAFAANLAYDQGPGTGVAYAWNDGNGSGPTHYISIPTPATAIVLALGGLGARRGCRRRC